MNNQKSHRCKQLLEYNENTYKPCCIRYEPWLYNESPTWILSALENDSEWDSTFMWHTAKIIFCPFCGKELKESEN